MQPLDRADTALIAAWGLLILGTALIYQSRRLIAKAQVEHETTAIAAERATEEAAKLRTDLDGALEHIHDQGDGGNGDSEPTGPAGE